MSATTVEELKILMSKKDAIESEIKELSDVLESQKAVGMDGPLLDAEQFPRSDIDLYTVREARHRIICLQNDHKLLMKQIEDGLYEIHAKTRAQKEAKEKKDVDTVMDIDGPEIISRAFVRVDRVDGGSPAQQAGLEVGDLIVRFGSVTSENFSTLQDIGKLTQHSVGDIDKKRLQDITQHSHLSVEFMGSFNAGGLDTVLAILSQTLLIAEDNLTYCSQVRKGNISWTVAKEMGWTRVARV